jgi:RNA polymerase sporulation-specific sigma factor
MNELVENNLNLVHHILKRFYPPNSMYDYDDLFQIGCIGLFKASKKYDESKGKFSTLACRCIIHEVVREIRYQNTPLRKVDDPLYLDHGLSHDSELADIIPSTRNVENQVINSILVEQLIEAEPVIIPLMLEGYNRYQIAILTDCTHVNTVWRKVNKLKEIIS